MTRVAATRPVVPSSTPRATVAMSSNDPTQHVSKLAAGQFKLSGVGSNNGTKASQLTVKFGDKTVTVPIGRGQTPGKTAALLQKAAPAGYTVDFRLTHRHLESDVIIDVKEKPAPSKTPTVKVSSNDPTQHVTSTGKNTFEIGGMASNNGFVPSYVSVTVDGKEVRVSNLGTTQQTAQAIAAALPKGYKAVITTKPVPPFARIDPRAWPVEVKIVASK